MQINNVELTNIAVRMSQYPTDNLPEFLLVGRSNVGKSSFINAIIERKNYARTSSKPGKTTTLNFYQINKKMYLVDVPGYGYSKNVKKDAKKFGLMIEEYLKTRENLKEVFMLVDSRMKPTEDDVLMYNFLKFYNLKINVIGTKMDKVNKNDRIKQEQVIKDTLKINETDTFINFSSLTKKGKSDVHEILNKYN